MILANIRGVLNANNVADKLPVKGIRVAAANVFAVHEVAMPDEMGG